MNSENRIFEWRSYSFAPGAAQTYLSMFQAEGLPFVTRHLPLLGYWITESGRLNMLHHLWVYDDLVERSQRRIALAADREWTGGFGPKAFPLIQSQQSVLMHQVTGSARLAETLSSKGNSIAALEESSPLFASTWASLVWSENNAPHERADLVGRWQVISGEAPGTFITLSKSDQPGDIEFAPKAVLRHEIVRPCAFSPLR